MDIIQAIALGVLQGATEFIPVSSSGHLVLVPWLLGWGKPELVFDTTLHLGTLLAVLAYFWRDWREIGRGWLKSLTRRGESNATPEARLGWLIIIGTVPAAAMGVALEDFFESLFGSPAWVAALLLVTGAILVLSERLGRRNREMKALSLSDAALIGLAQGLAIAPGISRSGATIAMGLLLGLVREDAAHFSFLLATPIILGAGLLQLFDALSLFAAVKTFPLIIGFMAASLSGFFCIHFLLSYLRRGRLYLFAAYCGLFGMLSLAVAFYGGERSDPTPLTHIRVAGSTSMLPLIESLAESYRQEHPQVIFEIQGGGSRLGYELLSAGKVEIGASSWPLLSESWPGKTKAAEIALDGLAIIVHSTNPLEDLTLDQAKDIFAGRIVDWRELSGRTGDILVVSREEGSGSRAAFEALMMKGQEVTSTAVVMPGEREVAEYVAAHPNAIGYASACHLTPEVKALRLDGVAPTPEAIREGEYPLTRPLLLLTVERPPTQIQSFLDFILSPEGRAIVKRVCKTY
ncbi:MAG: undecaprenyl-diphosphatase UppP [Anaerolineae bacterium]